MTRISPLNSEQHAHYRVRQHSNAAELRLAMLGISEVGRASADFPVCLAKEGQTGRFNLIALLSLVEPRNLYWRGQEWQATYIPETTQIAPFLLDQKGILGLAIDEDSDTIGEDGLPLFDPDGQPTDSLKDVSIRINNIVGDVARGQAFVNWLAELRLIRPLTCLLRLRDGREHQIDGLFSLGTEAVASLSNDLLLEFHHSGGLAAAAIMRASLGQFERLRRLHNNSCENPIASISAVIDE